ncbi:restriction endonuclease subunit S [Aeromonas caviae]|uniref:restriction endonuclease subunit S n=2 Tax=Aeromonas caviae TaxID=648 RepID=UPI002449589C|nr:restriction endonuclease subunit S [Aeromonas caviae]MDH0350792.1 restriction endonuclease subunit S [Aeromonas caviae]MDX7862386.1 restriction endonuclease subunit S [Aeromonas caviae]
MAIENLITDHLDLWTAAVRPKSSAGRGSNSKLELTGIKKLRELILELAVRGKLVPQDPNDEPASVLLERIAAEKTLLVKEGKIKKPKALPEIGEEDKPFELPEGWEWRRLPDICDYFPGKTPSTKNPIYWGELDIDTPWVSISDMQHSGIVNLTSKKITTRAVDDVFKRGPTPAGTILMSFKLTVGKISYLGFDAYHNEAILSIYPFSGISKEFLFHFLPSIALRGNTKNAIMGNTLNAESLSMLQIPIPPEDEQHRIVAKVDELMALCDQLELRSEVQLAAHQTLVEALLATLTDSADADELAQNWARLSTHFDILFTTEASIDALKQTILQLAVMGKLVPQDPSDEPASVLLKRIAAEKSILIKKGEIKNSLSTDSVIMDNCNWALSSGWSSIELQHIFRFIDYRGKNPEKSSHGVRLITAKNIRNGVIKNEPIEYISKELYDEWMVRGFPKQRDILFITEGHTMGFVAQVNLDFKFALAQRTICLQPYSEIVPEYLLIALMTMQFQKSVKDNETGSAAGGIKASKLKRLLLPIPPLAEQARIVSKAERLSSLCDQLKSRLQTSQQTQLALAEALVEGALS